MTLSLINDARRMYTSYSSLERRGVDRRALEATEAEREGRETLGESKL